MADRFEFLAFLRGYTTAALWSSSDEHGGPLDAVFSADDISPACMLAMNGDCQDFCKANMPDLLEYCQKMKNEQCPGEELAGHDFWLTRNGHGAGFWDRGLGELGKRLSDSAKVYGSVDLYAGDDGFIYGV